MKAESPIERFGFARLIRSMPKVVIALVAGYAIGGGWPRAGL